MKTTIDIPEALYKKAKIRAVEQGQTLRDIMLTSLIHELESPLVKEVAQPTFAERRKLLPDFAQHQASGAFQPKTGETDITELISGDRDAR